MEIDGRRLEVIQEGAQEFHSILMPYSAHASPLDLAKDIIDHKPSFMQR